MVHFRLHAGVLFFIVVVPFPLLCSGIRSILSREGNSGAVEVLSGYRFAEAPEYRNGRDCPVLTSNGRLVSSCEPSLVHIAMTLDSEYLRGSIAGRGKREVGGRKQHIQLTSNFSFTGDPGKYPGMLFLYSSVTKRTYGYVIYEPY
ncbi:hypothetical protein NC653_013244 [Populus alba x Populus x berolinensis]|uniref:Uncharacterized protein n=1 Tax=Populus alba x Populus x berolinensis TaxID=444605 RepID=A0AAD6QTV9_9ROSI|nr:hypothetical protein NC653_013244 [Populus alba x Populus x berolinensis]